MNSNYRYNVRDASGRFVAKRNAPVKMTKDDYIAKLKMADHWIEYTNQSGNTNCGTFTLTSDVLVDYKGSGKSKTSPSNILFAYNVDLDKFQSINIDTITHFEIN